MLIRSCIRRTRLINQSSSSRREEKMSLEKRRHSLFGCLLLQDATRKMSFPPNVSASSQTIFHRFFANRTFKQTDAFSAAMGCFLLGCKVEEVPIQVRDVVFVFVELFQERKRLTSVSLDTAGELFQRWKHEVVTIERIVLKELGFSLYAKIDHPHQYIVYITDTLQKNEVLAGRESQLSTLAESAWHYLNESKKTDVELEYAALAIACASILLASKVHNIDLPDGPQSSWWDLFNVEYQSMQEICNRILDVYDLDVGADSWIAPLIPVEYLRSTESVSRSK